MNQRQRKAMFARAKQYKQHIKRMEAIIKATEPFVTDDRSMEFQTSDNYREIRFAHSSAKQEIEWTKERMYSE